MARVPDNAGSDASRGRAGSHRLSAVPSRQNRLDELRGVGGGTRPVRQSEIVSEYAGAPKPWDPKKEIEGICVGRTYKRLETGEPRTVRDIRPDRDYPSGYLVEYDTLTGQGFADLDLFISLTQE